ncbi:MULTISPECIES: recombination-associated protein RdgC [Pseudomonas]|jgi:recombination associated protein RdgC|uniref:Recombination-associated protein RdgC n=1 Tax=Pseudomonas weihenstephanensis TaxID=1608994 RepID=A0A0J6IVU4_9PSED|nr:MULTISPECIES: recombination-associated protein RdgC [Pseudomonas]GLX88207.1 recombination-associated protein RdgC [Pseudomonas fragi]KMN15833.1 recombinase RdgC [Pseudomonas weihenstephanensis]KMN18470.1 recombinase RdgC [Pseudomonas weihenstephanensis]KVV09492.1 Recombination-associated protein RdgC [Pseudomonas sp. TAD18]KVV10174.1 Recombination-associated protein RdgC [Pseudomonas sp. TAA207]
MWFKNLLIYRLTQDLPFDAQVLETALATKLARACSSQELATYGFVAPFGKGEDAPLVHVSQDFLLIAARKEERILPGSVVRDALKEKVEEIEAEQMRKVYKKERDQLKDEIIQAFLPRAFIRRSATFAAIAPKQGLILVNASSPKRAEDLLSTLREVVGSLPVRPLAVKVAPSATMTEWVKTQKAADNFFVLDECELRDTHEDGGIIRCKRQDLTSDEIQLHLSTGKVVTQLSLAWQDKLSFVLDDKLVVKRLKFEDLLQDEAEQNGGDDDLGQQDASFTLMMLTFGEFLPQLFEALGGEEVPQGIE